MLFGGVFCVVLCVCVCFVFFFGVLVFTCRLDLRIRVSAPNDLVASIARLQFDKVTLSFEEININLNMIISTYLFPPPFFT